MWRQCNLVARRVDWNAHAWNDDFTVPVSARGRCRWVSMCNVWLSHTKWLSEHSKKSSINFCVKLEHSFAETIQLIQKATAIGNWWLAASSQHLSCIMSHADFFGKTSSHPGDSVPLQHRFGALQLLDFPKLKSPLKGKRFLRFWKVWQGNWENWVRSQAAYFEGDWGLIVLYTMFPVSSINVSIFYITWLDTFWTDANKEGDLGGGGGGVAGRWWVEVEECIGG